MQITVCRRRWSLVFTKKLTKGTDGECDPPTKPGKEIRIKDNLPPQDTLETLIHEMFHAANWTLDEEHITESARDIARGLWKLGYRRQGVDE
jgi:hypothetical protein